MNANEFIDFVINVNRLKGMSRTQSIEYISHTLKKEKIISDTWEQHKGALKTSSGLIPLTIDVQVLGAIALEMKRSGNTFAKYQIKTYKGNPKVISFSIGKLGVKNAIKGGFITTIIISVTFHAFEQMLNDQATWHDFIGGLAVDVGVAAVSSGIAWGSIATYVGGTAAMVAVGPMLAVVVVGGALTLFTSAFIDSDSLSKRISDSLRDLEEDTRTGLANIQKDIKQAEHQYTYDPVGFMHRLFGIPYYGRRY
ncbi:hypothetical protein [uncultured Photobacterium sp.]|uniref:hypothetical protein n=1 Tax=uncultured Photobacterium sp. TaxID=173973 RepID=UPI00260CF54E|nr:hypothetical protein [uncultured Photobacterium sp.]